MNELLHIIQGWIVSAGALGVFGASLAEELISIIPSAAVQTASGAFMMSGHVFSLSSLLRLITMVVIPASLGVMIGSLPYMYLSRRYGAHAIDRWGTYIGVTNADIENISIKDMKNAQERHKDLKTMMITPEQLEHHKAVGDCWILT